jgi:polysaccharide export outer membrane protein
MKSVNSLLAVLLLHVAAASAAQPVAPAAGPPSADTAGAAAMPAPVPSAGEMGEESSYIIGPGDTIQVFVWRNPELSITVPVRSDGKVTTPLVEDIVAVGLTPSGLARAMEVRLAEYIRSPQVNIIVTSAQSAFSKVTVIGQVASQQAVPYRKGMTLLEVVLAVGGLSEFAAGNRAWIMRKDADGKETRIPVKIVDLIKKGRTKENVEMQPGDMLVVPESRL